MNKKTISQIAFEFLSIVFAVLLALGLNSYKQNLDLENEAELLTGNIILECKENLQKLDSTLEINQAFKLYIDSLLQAEEIRGFHFSYNNELLSSISWNFTKASKSFPYMDQGFLNDAAEVYEHQAYYMENSNQMFEHLGNIIIQIDNIKPRTLARTGDYYLSNLIGAAEELKTFYEEFLKKYEGSDPFE